MAEPRHVSELLPMFVNGSADEAERAAVEGHVAACARCAGELEDWRRVAVSVRQDLPTAPDTAVVMGDVWQRVGADSGAAEVAPSRGQSSWSRALRPVWSTAAVLVLVFALLVVERASQSPQEVLLAAAVRTAAQEAAALRLAGTARFEVAPPEGDPSAPASGAEGLTLDIGMRGQGAVRFGESLHVRLRLDLDGGALGVADRSETIERLVVGAQRFERGPSGEWAPLDERAGLIGLALLNPRLPELVLSNAEGPIEVADVAEQVEGVAVRRYAFDLAPAALPQPEGATLRYRAEVWLGETDGLLHALRVRGSGPASTPIAGQWDIDLLVDLVDIGEPVAIPSPVGTPGGR